MENVRKCILLCPYYVRLREDKAICHYSYQIIDVKFNDSCRYKLPPNKEQIKRDDLENR